MSKLGSNCWYHMPHGRRSAKVTDGLPTPLPLIEQSLVGPCIVTVQLNAVVVMTAVAAIQS